MVAFSKSTDQCLLLIKALPHRSHKYSETVCCAGLGRDGKWRRQYPVPFRVLQPEQQFGRWNWIEYEYTKSTNDPRPETQKVDPDSIQVIEKIEGNRRFHAVRSAFRASTDEATSKGETLTLLRPRNVAFQAFKKSASEIESENRKHAELAAQQSLFSRTVEPLKVCPYAFKFRWIDQDGKEHFNTCDDWETSEAFRKRLKHEGSEEKAIQSLRQTYEVDYPSKGIAFGLGTHSRFSDTWLLVGVLRVDDDQMRDLFA